MLLGLISCALLLSTNAIAAPKKRVIKAYKSYNVAVRECKRELRKPTIFELNECVRHKQGINLPKTRQFVKKGKSSKGQKSRTTRKSEK